MGRILRFLQPHLFDHKPSLIHAAIGKFPAVLVEADTAQFRNPGNRLFRRPDKSRFLQVTVVYHHMPQTGRKIEIPAKNDMAAVILQTECGACIRTVHDQHRDQNWNKPEYFHFFTY